MAQYLKNELYELIKKDERVFDFLQESSLDGLWYWDLENPENKWMNPRFWEVLGYDSEKMPNRAKAWKTIINPDDFKATLDHFQAHLTNPEKAYEQEIRYTHKNGSIVWMQCLGLAIRNESGKPVRMFGTSRDITKQKQAAQQLKESEEKFRQIFEHANIGIAISDPTGKVLEVNEGYLSITGYSYEEFIGMNYANLTTPDDLRKEKILLQELIDGKRNSYRIEKRLTCKNGDFVWLDANLTSIRKSNHEIERLIILVVDITEKKKATESMQVFFEQPMNLHVIASIDGIMIKVNSGCENILGYKKDELEGTNFLDLVHPDDIEATVNEMKSLDKGMQVGSFENRYRHKLGHYITLAWSSKASASSHQIHAIAKDITEEKMYHEALLKSEENYKALSENANHLIITHDLDGKISYVNRFALEFTGMSKEQIIGSDITQFISDPDQLQKLDQRKNNIEKGELKISQHELPIVLPNGKQYHLYIIASPICRGDKVESILITAYNITQKKNNEIKIQEQNEAYESLNEELRQSNNELFTSIQREEEINERFTLAMQASSEGLWDWDIVTNKVYFSPRWKGILGYHDDELGNDLSVWENHTHPEDLAEAYDVLDRLIKDTKDQFDIEYRMQHKNGQWLALSSRAKIFYNSKGEPTRLVGTHTDVTQKKLAENQLKESEEKLRLAIDNSPLGISFCDMKGDFISANLALQKILGYSKDELERMNIFDVTHPNFVPENNKLLQQLASKTRKEFLLEKKYIRKDGKLIDARVHSGTILDKQGKPMFAMAFIEDISELKKTLDDLKLAKQKAEESNALKTQFLHNMSHEIRTPMNGIMGFSDLLSETDGQSEEQKNYTSIIRNSSQQLLQIIDDILEISTLETKQLTIQENEFDVNQFIMELFAIYDLKSKDRNLALYVKKALPSANSLIISDKTKIHKILSNLLENAFKFTSSGKIELGYTLEDDSIVFFVKDTGIGISCDRQSRIFERFSQESSQTAQEFGGLGLGLSIAKENTELLNGTIKVESTKGKGSSFYVKIPYHPANQSHKNASSNRTEDESLEFVNILIAEDEEVNYLYLEAILEDTTDFNIKLHHVIDGEEAVDRCLNDDTINLVLMDIKMPVMNGYVATEKIKAVKPTLPIIAQTAYSTASEKEMALSHGCDEFISKPINKHELFLLLTKYLKEQ